MRDQEEVKAKGEAEDLALQEAAEQGKRAMGDSANREAERQSKPISCNSSSSNRLKEMTLPVFFLALQISLHMAETNANMTTGNTTATSSETFDDLIPTDKNAIVMFRPSVLQEQLQGLFVKEKVFDLEKIGKQVQITQEWGAGGTGAASWLGGHVLADFLTRFVDLQAEIKSSSQHAGLLSALREHADGTWGWAGKQVVELGAGLGLCSITAALMGASVVATDGDADILHLTSANVERNLESAKGNASVKLLEWDRWEPVQLLANLSLDSSPHVVMGADIVYGEDRKVWRNLVSTLDAMCGPHSVVLLAQTTRYDTEAIFFHMLFARFQHLKVERRFLHPDHRGVAAMTVYVLWKKKR
jgi:2-polyprenyl-3-methyl-5-hydroxy-6-metoxy-1,4-benzoquinol methylase